jgi:hypothetical protein
MSPNILLWFSEIRSLHATRVVRVAAVDHRYQRPGIT